MKNESKTPSSGGFKTKIKSLWQRVWGFVEPNYPLFLAPFIVVCLYLFMCLRLGVYPFGDNTVASYDLSAQIAPFIEHLFDVMDGRASLFFSYSIAGGADVFGTFAYFFVSPFSFLFLILGEGMVAHTSIIVMALKMICIAFAGAWFAQKLFKNIPLYVCTAIGVLYAYCGYTFVSNTYINWMDLLIYLPFAAHAFVHFVRTGKYLPFSLLVAACIYTCFSLVSFSLMTVFPALVCYGLICVEKGKKMRFIGQVCLSFVVAVLISFPILFSSLLSFVNSARGGDLFVNLYWGLSADGTFNAESFKNWWGIGFAAKWSYILSDSIFVCLTAAYFLKEGLKKPMARFMFVCFLLTIVPTIVDESMNLLNAGSYMSYALRFGFLNAFFFMACTCLFLDTCSFKLGHAYDGELISYQKQKKVAEPDFISVSEEPPVEEDVAARESITEESLVELVAQETPVEVVLEEISTEEEKKQTLFQDIKRFFKTYRPRAPHFICIGVTLIIFGVLLWFLGTDAHITIWEKLGLSDDWRFHSSAFAHSIGGLPVMTAVFAAVGVAMLVCGFFAMNKKVSVKFVSICMAAIAVVQVCFYSEQLVHGNLSTQHIALEDYRQVCEMIDDDEYYRVKDYSESVNKNAPFQTNAPAYSVFSSVIHKSNFKLATLFGYNGNGRNSLGSSGSSSFGDAFLGYKYVVVEQGKRKQAESLTHLKLATYTEDGVEKVIENDAYCVFENTVSFPFGFTVNEGEFRLEKENTAENRRDNQIAFFRYLTGDSSYESVSTGYVRSVSAQLWNRAAEIEVGANTIHATVSAEAGMNLLLNFVALDGYTAKVNGKEVELVKNDLDLIVVPLEAGENVIELKYTSPYPKYFAVAAVISVLLLAAVFVITKKTKFMDKCGKIIGWLGVLLAAGVTGFFFVFPTGVWTWKLIRLFFPFFF